MVHGAPRRLFVTLVLAVLIAGPGAATLCNSKADCDGSEKDSNATAAVLLQVGKSKHKLATAPSPEMDTWRVDVSLAAAPASQQNVGALHEVVGSDGVLLLSLPTQPQRTLFTLAQLKTVNIHPTLFAATNGATTPQFLLNYSCNPEGPGMCARAHNGSPKSGIGCQTTTQQAIAASHHRALLHALNRSQEWTAILEDDVMPTFNDTGRWEAEFRQAWAQRPLTATVVRLNWCYAYHLRPFGAQPTADGSFTWVQSPTAGGCTSAYMVHKSIIPEMLGVFPCCTPVDACLEHDFYMECDPRLPRTGTLRSMSMLANLDVYGSAEYKRLHSRNTWADQGGILMQARDQLGSTQR